MKVLGLIAIGWVALASRAQAAEVDVEGATQREATTVGAVTANAAPVGSFLALSHAASLEKQRATVTGFGGYDSARRTSDFEASAEVRLWGPIAIRGGAVYTNGNKTLRPSFGARVQLLRQASAGVDGAVGVFYRPEGLTEPEGEIESVVSVGRRLGGTYLLGNLLYGQDPEGRERDGEVRLAALRAAGERFLFGFDSRLRFDLGSDQALLAQHGEPTLDAMVGPVATALLGPVALSLEAGGSGLRLQQKTSYGLFFLAGVGSAF